MSILYLLGIILAFLIIFGILGWVVKGVCIILELLFEGTLNCFGYIILGIFIILLLAVLI